jgi:hypothetical protein
MTLEKAVKAVTIGQIHEALEERQTPDRRKVKKGVPEEVGQDRRKGDRRKQADDISE